MQIHQEVTHTLTPGRSSKTAQHAAKTRNKGEALAGTETNANTEQHMQNGEAIQDRPTAAVNTAPAFRTLTHCTVRLLSGILSTQVSPIHAAWVIIVDTVLAHCNDSTWVSTFDFDCSTHCRSARRCILLKRPSGSDGIRADAGHDSTSITSSKFAKCTGVCMLT